MPCDYKPTVVVRDREFLRDLRFTLRPHLGIPMGQLDEAIAFGLGSNTRAALLAKLGTLPTELAVDDDKFRARVGDFGASAPEGLFERSVLDCMKSPYADVLVGFLDDRQKARGRVKVRLVRVPSTKELPEFVELETFLSAFQVHATSPDPMVAIATDLGDVVDIDGYRIPVGPTNSWLVVIGPA